MCVYTHTYTHTHTAFSVQLMRLYAKYRQAEVHCKALAFQKDYLKGQVDAFFQIQQAALIMMAQMGAPVERKQIENLLLPLQV